MLVVKLPLFDLILAPDCRIVMLAIQMRSCQVFPLSEKIENSDLNKDRKNCMLRLLGSTVRRSASLCEIVKKEKRNLC